MKLAPFLVVTFAVCAQAAITNYLPGSNEGDSECSCDASSRARRNCVLEDIRVVRAYRQCAAELNVEEPFWLREKRYRATYGGCWTESDIDDWEINSANRQCWSRCVWRRLGVLDKYGYVNPHRMVHFIEDQANGVGIELSQEKWNELETCVQQNSTVVSGNRACQAAWRAHECWWYNFWSTITFKCMEDFCTSVGSHNSSSNDTKA